MNKQLDPWARNILPQEGTALPQRLAAQNCTPSGMGMDVMHNEAIKVSREEIFATENLKNEMADTIRQLPSELIAKGLKEGDQPISKLTVYSLIYWKLSHMVFSVKNNLNIQGLDKYQSMISGYCFLQAIYIYLTHDTNTSEVSFMRNALKEIMNGTSVSGFLRKSIATAVSSGENGFPVKWLPFSYVVYNGQDVSQYNWIIADKHIYFNPNGQPLQGEEKLDPDVKLGKGPKGPKKQQQKKVEKQVRQVKKAVKAVKKEEKKIKRQFQGPKKSSPWWKRGLQVAGNIAGSFLGQPKAGNYIFGHGDYVMNTGIKANNLINPTAPGGPPKFRAQNHSTVISRKEYLGDIMGTPGFSTKTYTVQPSDAVTFPWLSQIARNYKTYRFTGLVFYYESMSGGVVSTNPTLGQIGMLSSTIGTPLPTNKVSFESNNNVMNTSPDKSMAYGLECSPSQLAAKMFTVRVPGVTGLSDDHIDFAKFQIYVNGTPSTSFLGELWVTYTIVLDDPYEYIEYSGQVDKYYVASPGTLFPSTVTNPLANSNLGTNVVNNTINFPDGMQSGYYSVNIYLQLNSAGTAIPSLTYAASTNLVGQNWFSSNSINRLASPYGGSAACRYYSTTCIYNKTDALPATLTINGMNPGSAGVVDMIVSSLPSSLFAVGMSELQITPNIETQELKVSKGAGLRQQVIEHEKRTKSVNASFNYDESDVEGDEDDELGVISLLLKTLGRAYQKKKNDKRSMSVLE